MPDGCRVPGPGPPTAIRPEVHGLGGAARKSGHQASNIRQTVEPRGIQKWQSNTRVDCPASKSTVVCRPLGGRSSGERRCARADRRRGHEQWGMIANGTNRVTERVGDPNEFSVSPGSSLFGDDEHSDPYQLSHAVQMCLVARIDHLHTAKSHLLDFHVLPAASLFSLVRGALENFGAAYWMLGRRAATSGSRAVCDGTQRISKIRRPLWSPSVKRRRPHST